MSHNYEETFAKDEIRQQRLESLGVKIIRFTAAEMKNDIIRSTIIGYWVKEAAPASDKAWNASLKQIDDDLEQFIDLFKKEDICQKIPHGNGQSILREALQIADHTAYHISEIIVIRRCRVTINNQGYFSPLIKSVTVVTNSGFSGRFGWV